MSEKEKSSTSRTPTPVPSLQDNSNSQQAANMSVSNIPLANIPVASTPALNTHPSSLASPSSPTAPAGLQARVSTLQAANSMHSTPPDRVRDDPDFDYSGNSVWYQGFVLFVICDTVISTLTTIILSATDGGKLVEVLIPTALIWEWLPIYNLISLVIFVLNSLLIETLRVGQDPRWSSRKREILVSVLKLTNFLYLFFMQLPIYTDIMLLFALCFYVFCALLQRSTLLQRFT